MTPLERLDADASNRPGTWTFSGHTFILRNKLDLRVQVALRRGEFDRALTYALGAEQVDTLMELDDPVDETALADLMAAWAAAAGTTPGESSASSNSSRNTARPSKRTSNVRSV